ncbi:MAG: dihydrofolate reductase family protein [Gaiellaceae bacterium]
MTVVFDITVSLDGFVAGPSAIVEKPLGEGGERLHEWIYALPSWRERHGGGGGESGVDVDEEVYRAHVESTGAVVMGRRMFSGGEGPWEADPVAEGWWGEEPPFGVPVFVLTHHPRRPLEKRGTTFFFVSDGVESALAQARDAAADRNVLVAGGAATGRQLLDAGLVDELQLHVAPTLLGAGVRLFEGIEPARLRLRPLRVIDSPHVTHVRYRILH